MTNDIETTLKEDGYVIVPNALSSSDCEPLESEYASLLAERTVSWRVRGRIPPVEIPQFDSLRDGLNYLSSMPDFDVSLLSELDITLPHRPFDTIEHDTPFHIGPGVLELATNPRLLSIIQELVGKDVALSPNSHVRFKLPAHKHGTTTDWHRDAMTQHPQSDPIPVVTAWIPMHDVSEYNGCLVAIPGGNHRYRHLTWPLSPAIVQHLNPLGHPLPVNHTDIILLDKNTPHASLPNFTDSVRWSFDFRFLPAAGPSDRPWFPSLQVLQDGNPPNPPPTADQWKLDWLHVRDQFASTKEPVPGSSDYARFIAAQQHIPLKITESHIQRWENGHYPRPSPRTL